MHKLIDLALREAPGFLLALWIRDLLQQLVIKRINRRLFKWLHHHTPKLPWEFQHYVHGHLGRPGRCPRCP